LPNLRGIKKSAIFFIRLAAQIPITVIPTRYNPNTKISAMCRPNIVFTPYGRLPEIDF